MIDNQHIFQEKIKDIVNNIQIVSEKSFLFLGSPVSIPPDKFNNNNEQPELIPTLCNILYQYCYTQNINNLSEDTNTSPTDMTAYLANANKTKDIFSHNWLIEQVNSQDLVTIKKDDKKRNIWSGDFVTTNAVEGSPKQGDIVSVFERREHNSSGYYFAYGETDSWDFELSNIIRFYWNLKQSGAIQLMELITHSFNRFQIPFRYKCGNQTTMYNRIDSAVLYVNKPSYRITRVLLEEILPSITDHLLSDTPLFTKKLADGLGFAEEPGTGESFGMYRCQILAKSIYNTWLSGDINRITSVLKELENHGVNGKYPYLCHTQRDNYQEPNGVSTYEQ